MANGMRQCGQSFLFLLMLEHPPRHLLKPLHFELINPFMQKA